MCPFFFFILIPSLYLDAQSVVVIPFFKQGQDKRVIIESDECYRAFETLVKESFLKEDRFGLVDYLALVRKMERDDITIPSNSDGAIEMVLKYADPDIYIIADITPFQKGNEYAYRINLTAFWTNTGETLASTILDSGQRYFDDCFLLINKAMLNKDMDGLNKMESFIQTMKEMKVGQASEAAQPISLLFTKKSEDYDYLDRLTNGKLLFQSIQDWLKEHSIDKHCDCDIDSKFLRCQKILIGIEDKDGNKYSPSEFGGNLLIFLSGLTFKEDEIQLDFDFKLAGNNLTFILE